MKFFLLVCILDGLVIGWFLASVCEGIFGDKPFARLLRLIVSVGGGIAYAVWAIITCDSSEISLLGGAIIIFAPAALFLLLILVLWIKNYMFDQDNKKS